jgi:RNA polymerase sigma-70 factor (ECF subfamily)
VALTEIDRRLLKQCLAKAPGAWEDFVDRFLGVIVHVIRHTAHARSVPLGDDDLDDLCSEVFVTLLQDDFRVLRNFRGESALSTYLTVIARRVAVREISRRRQAEAMGHVAAHQAAVDGGEVASSTSARLENNEELRVVEMFYLEGQSYRRISVELGIAENSIGPILSRARSQLGQSGAAVAAR